MALELLQSGINPIGQYDGYDLIATTVKGGEVATLIGVALASDRAAYDASGVDGYVGTSVRTRPVVTTLLAAGSRPLYLVDDGLVGYGTALGSVIGGVGGQQTYANFTGAPGVQYGTLLGPHTATGSGKLTLWATPGTFAVTLDAVDTNATTGLQPTNPTLAVGDALYATAAGLLTPNETASFDGSGQTPVARFINFKSHKGSSLVTTPVFLVSAQNSPVGQGQPQRVQFTRAEFQFTPPSA